MAWLALWWKLSGFTPAVTRTAMLLVAAVGLTAVFRIARQAMNTRVALAATVCTALYPVWFTQSSMAHLDMAAAAFALWGLAFFLEDRRALCLAAFSLAVLAKETAVIVPLALASWELLWWLLAPATRAHRFSRETRNEKPETSIAPALQPLGGILSLLLVPAAVLTAWFGYHYHRTGYVFGNPEFFRYNVTQAAHPLRILLACLRRLWQVTGYMDLFVLTLAGALALRLPPLPEIAADPPAPRPRIEPRTQAVMLIVVLAHVVFLSFVGGAVLARYMLMAVPLVIILCVSTLRRRVRGWPLVIATVCAAFLFALFVNPPHRFAMEDNLAYRDYVLLHRSAADVLSAHYSASRVLTAWPASDELAKPYLGYVKTSLPVLPLENFSAPQVLAAARDTSTFDVAYVFSTKYEPTAQGALLRGWERLQEPIFDYHRDLPPEVIARAFGGRIVWMQERKGQWAALIVIERAENAKLMDTH